MKHIFLSLLLAVSLFAAKAQTADEIIAKHLEAMGGKEKLMALNSMVMEATMDLNGNSIPIKISQVNNKGQRVDISINGTENYMIQTPTEGWNYFPIQGQMTPEASPADLVKETQDALDIQSPLMDYAEKGHKVEKLENEDFDGVDCFRIKETMKNGLVNTYYFDPANYYIIKSVTKSKGTGQEVEQTQTFSNFKKTDDGYVFPYSMTGMGPGEITVTSIQVNTPVDENIFKKSE